MPERSQLKAQVEKIRAEIQRHGQSFVGGEELRVLCPEEAILNRQFNRVSEIAQYEHWSFAFCPTGEVRFEKLANNHSSN